MYCVLGSVGFGRKKERERVCEVVLKKLIYLKKKRLSVKMDRDITVDPRQHISEQVLANNVSYFFSLYFVKICKQNFYLYCIVYVYKLLDLESLGL